MTSLGDVIALWDEFGFRWSSDSFGSKVSLAMGSPCGTSSGLVVFPSPSFFSGSFIWLLQLLSLRCGFAFFYGFWLSLRSLYFLALGVHRSFPFFDPGSPFLALFCVSLRLVWLGVRRVLRLPFASLRSEVFVGLRFRRSGFWTLGCGSCPWPLWLRL